MHEKLAEGLSVRAEFYLRRYSPASPRMDGCFPKDSDDEIRKFAEPDLFVPCTRVRDEIGLYNLRFPFYEQVVERKRTRRRREFWHKPILPFSIEQVFTFFAKQIGGHFLL